MRGRFRGALLGTFIGDALGAPYEGLSRAQIVREVGPVTDLQGGRLGCGRYTDDTEMMIGLAQGLIDAEGALDLDFIAERFALVFTPYRGYGRNTRAVLESIKGGAPWHLAAARHTISGGSFGNGAAMRVAPVALAFLRDRDLAASSAQRQGMITGHSHPLGEWGSRIQALAVRRALRSGAAGRSFDPMGFIERLLSEAPPEPYKTKLTWIQRHLDVDGDVAVVALGNGVAAQDSVPIALWTFLKFRDEPARAVSEAVAAGGDTDTIAAMTGAIVGAYHGVDCFPARWLDGLENEVRGRDHVMGLADDMFDLIDEHQDG